MKSKKNLQVQTEIVRWRQRSKRLRMTALVLTILLVAASLAVLFVGCGKSECCCRVESFPANRQIVEHKISPKKECKTSDYDTRNSVSRRCVEDKKCGVKK